MRPNVSNRVAGFNRPFEGLRYHMYLDTKGLVTIGIGNQISREKAITLPFRRGINGALVTDKEEIGKAWDSVNKAPWGIPTTEDGKDVYGGLTELRLNKNAIDVLVLSTANSFDGSNRAELPGYEGFSSDAQLGLLSMRWPGSWNKFPTFREHVKKGNWFGAAKECHFNEQGANIGLVARNNANRWLFSLAGRVKSFNLDPATLYYDNPGAHKLYLFKNKQYIRYDWDADKVDEGYPADISAWRIPSFLLDVTPFKIDAVVNGLGERKVPRYFGKTYFFFGSQYVRYDWDLDQIDYTGFLTEWGLTGNFAAGIDTAINGEGPWLGKLYFFKGDQYVRYDWVSGTIDQQPISISQGWSLPSPFDSNLDAIVSGEGRWAGKLYFFKGSEYIRCNWGSKPEEYRVEGPKQSISVWGGLTAKGFAGDIFAAVNPPGRS